MCVCLCVISYRTDDDDVDGNDNAQSFRDSVLFCAFIFSNRRTA